MTITAAATDRKALRTLAQELFTVEFDRYGVPRTLDGVSLGAQPWKALAQAVLAAQSAPVVAPAVEVVAECPAQPSPSSPSTLHHVAQEGRWEALPTLECEPAHTEVAVKPKHPLRGYVLTTKAKVCDALRALKRVTVDRVTNLGMFARLLAKHFGADVRVRYVDGQPWLLVQKGSSRRAFPF